MKNTKFFILIILGILAVHGAVLFCFIGTPAPRGVANDVKPEKKPQETVGKSNEKQQEKTVAEPEKSITPEAYRKIRAKRNLGRDFDYTYAVSGNIPAIPECVNATGGILVDLDTRTVLWAKNPRKSLPIASMTKLMTELVGYEMVEDSSGKYTLDTMVKVTPAAARIGGSQVFLDPRESFPLRDLFVATAVKSANDAAYLLAEFFGNGDVNAFVDAMNRKAAALRMTGTKFYNPNGLPGETAGEDNCSTPEDMAKLGEACLIHPQLIQWASTWQAPFRQKGSKGFMMLYNHNHLIPGSRNHVAGVDGLKTGFINRSGYCLAVSCIRSGRRVVGVVTGFPTWRERDRFVTNLLNWGYKRIGNPAQALLDDARVPPPKRKPMKRPASRMKKIRKAKAKR